MKTEEEIKQNYINLFKKLKKSTDKDLDLVLFGTMQGLAWSLGMMDYLEAKE